VDKDGGGLTYVENPLLFIGLWKDSDSDSDSDIDTRSRENVQVQELNKAKRI